MEEIKPSPRGLQAADVERGVRYINEIAGFFPNSLDTIVIIGLGADGSFSSSVVTHDSAVIGATLLPACAAEILRRNTLRNVCVDVMNGED